MWGGQGRAAPWLRAGSVELVRTRERLVHLIHKRRNVRIHLSKTEVVTFARYGDAFGPGGQFNLCFVVDVEGFRYAIELGATSLVALQQDSLKN
jgi:hypothetical protein